MKQDLSWYLIANVRYIRHLLIKAGIVGLVLVVNHAFADSPHSGHSSEEYPMVELASRVFDVAGGEVTLSLFVGDKVALTGKSMGFGRFYDLRLTSRRGKEESERTVWRQFRLDRWPAPQGKDFSDVLVATNSKDIYLCVGSDDSFALYIIPWNATPELKALPKLPLSRQDSDSLLRRRPKTEERPYSVTQPPEGLVLQRLIGSSIQNVDLEMKGGDIRLAFTIQGKEQPVVLHYSIATKTWRY